ncbi:MAG: hypothetical protein QXW79_00095 [Thermoplasmata archaeon]
MNMWKHNQKVICTEKNSIFTTILTTSTIIIQDASVVSAKNVLAMIIKRNRNSTVMNVKKFVNVKVV